MLIITLEGCVCVERERERERGRDELSVPDRRRMRWGEERKGGGGYH